MKSNKAKEFLESVKTTDDNDATIYLIDAVHAVELAEELEQKYMSDRSWELLPQPPPTGH